MYRGEKVFLFWKATVSQDHIQRHAVFKNEAILSHNFIADDLVLEVILRVSPVISDELASVNFILGDGTKSVVSFTFFTFTTYFLLT